MGSTFFRDGGAHTIHAGSLPLQHSGNLGHRRLAGVVLDAGLPAHALRDRRAQGRLTTVTELWR